VVEWHSGTKVVYSILSDGQKAILTIVGDIARRAALLNPHLDNPAAETPGVVVIDEIDLHLHPRWQRRIMEDLRRVFPKIQFIATTHSPIIISAAKDAKVILLEEGGSREVPQAYGMDVNWVVEAIQGAEPQAGEVAAMVRQAEDLIEEGKLDEARALVPKLERLQNGPSPDSVRITAEIDNLTALANAED
jgi:predicted ATP-binding protein involved in virulence